MADEPEAVKEEQETEEQTYSPEELEDLFVFDPMEEKAKPPEEPEKPTAPPAATPAEPAAPAAAAPTPAEPAAPAAPVPPTDPALLARLEAMERDNRALREQLTRAKPAEPAPKAPEPEPRIFGLSIPKQVRELLESEDGETRGQALETVINGALDVAYRHTMKKVEERLAALGKEIPTTVHSIATAKEQDQRVHDDFYSHYPGYNKPELKIFIASVAERVAAETNAQMWTPELRDAVGKRLESILGFNGKPAAAPPPNGEPPAEPPRAGGPRRVPSGARPPGGPAKDTQEAFMADLID
jgi:hypothetical protein